MSIERLNRVSAPAAPAAARAAAAPQAAAPKAAMAQDSLAVRESDVKVITYNTAIGNRAIKTDQADFIKLPFYQDVVNGKPHAPIMGLQEVGNDQVKALEEASKNGNFKVYRQHVGLFGRQNNALVVPKRYEVVEQDQKIYKASHLKGVAKTLWGWVKSGFKKDVKWSQLLEPRGYQEVRLKDTVTGKTFTVLNSHTSFHDQLKVAHNERLKEAAKEAERFGPVIVAGDLNTRTAETDPDENTLEDQARKPLLAGGYQDMGPKGTPPGKTNIDWVLAKGFESVSSKWYTGNSISLPGSPDALTVSDHYAEEDVLRFK